MIRSISPQEIAFWQARLDIWAKRLEQGSFQAYKAGDIQGQAIEVDATTLAMILGGVDVNSAKRCKRFALSA